MLESKLVKRTHELMLKPENKSVAIDATIGNGYDTLFLANYYDMHCSRNMTVLQNWLSLPL